MNLFFVCGAPKSGTTWVQRILDTHPEVCCSGEGHFISRFSVPLAKTVNSYNQELQQEAHLVYEDQPYYRGVDQAEFDEVVRGFILNRLRTRATEATRWMGDKTPGYTRYLNFLHRLFPDAKMIHIVRDPRDVAVSRMAFSRRAGKTQAREPGSEQYRDAVEGALRTWREAVTSVDAFAAKHPDHLCELHYRDLHADPIGEIGRLFQFLGAPTSPALLKEIAKATSFEAMSGRRPGVEDPDSFLRKGLPDDWRNDLDPQTAQMIAESCADLMREKRFAA